MKPETPFQSGLRKFVEESTQLVHFDHMSEALAHNAAVCAVMHMKDLNREYRRMFLKMTVEKFEENINTLMKRAKINEKLEIVK